MTGTNPSATHTTSVSLTVTTAGALVNGGFETGNLSGWSTGGGFALRVVTP